jgi:hypothetical protein
MENMSSPNVKHAAEREVCLLFRAHKADIERNQRKKSKRAQDAARSQPPCNALVDLACIDRVRVVMKATSSVASTRGVSMRVFLAAAFILAVIV